MSLFRVKQVRLHSQGVTCRCPCPVAVSPPSLAPCAPPPPPPSPPVLETHTHTACLALTLGAGAPLSVLVAHGGAVPAWGGEVVSGRKDPAEPGAEGSGDSGAHSVSVTPHPSCSSLGADNRVVQLTREKPRPCPRSISGTALGDFDCAEPCASPGPRT